jgi:hypothetical protein
MNIMSKSIAIKETYGSLSGISKLPGKSAEQ